ncbi:MAG: fatty acid desaturase [Deltaproteobacteria bacterium]|nr:fatty acid desaturase [Deltaproteobacteria bacterium]
MRPALPPEVFEPATSRLALVPAHVGVISIAMLAIIDGWVPWMVWPLLSIAIGVSMSCLTFVAHETVHGGIVRNRTVRHIIGFIGFLPFMVSPRLWAAWHDRVHHSTANVSTDPDTYPTLAEYHSSLGMRIMVDKFAPGGGRWRGILTLMFGFTGQSTIQLLQARQRQYLKPPAFRLAMVETALGIAIWTTLAIVAGFVPFLFVFLLPLIVANAMVMAFILTNHSLSPRVEINDPVVSGLTVTSPAWFEWLTLYFGYHVEHHVFPAMSSRHSKRVRALLQQKWPQRYKSMSFRKALIRIHRTARVYKDAVTLVDPMTGREFPTLTPSDLSPAVE